MCSDLTSKQNGYKWLASHSVSFTLKKVSNTHWTGGWVGPHGQSAHFGEDLNYFKLSLFKPSSKHVHYPDNVILPLWSTERPYLFSEDSFTLDLVPCYYNWGYIQTLLQLKLPQINVGYQVMDNCIEVYTASWFCNWIYNLLVQHGRRYEYTIRQTQRITGNHTILHINVIRKLYYIF